MPLPVKSPLTNRLQNESKLPRNMSEPNLPIINSSSDSDSTPVSYNSIMMHYNIILCSYL